MTFPRTATATGILTREVMAWRSACPPTLLSIKPPRLSSVTNANIQQLTMNQGTSSQIQEQANALRQGLKEWEKSFAAANQGRRAGREDIKAHPTIGTAPHQESPPLRHNPHYIRSQLTSTNLRDPQHPSTKPTPNSATSSPVKRPQPTTPPRRTHTNTRNRKANPRPNSPASGNTRPPPPPPIPQPTRHPPTKHRANSPVPSSRPR